MSKRIISGFHCPECKEESLTYNGNYFCTNPDCDWANPEVDLPLEDMSTWTLELMTAYMVKYQENEEWQFYIDPIQAELNERRRVE